jgi:hypothetical protein
MPRWPGAGTGPGTGDGEPSPCCGGAGAFSDRARSRSSPDRGGGGVLVGLSFPYGRGDDGSGDVPVHRLPRCRGNLEAPQLPEKEYEVAAERRSNVTP